MVQRRREEDLRMNNHKHMSTYVKIVSIQTGIMCLQLNWNDVRRLVDIDGDDLQANTDDPLGTILVDGLEQLKSETDDTDIQPSGSICALFETGDLQRSLKARLHMVISVRDGVEMVGGCVSCFFMCDAALGTSLFTHKYCIQHTLPRFGSTWMLLDIVASRRRPAGALLTTHAIISACRAKCAGICAIAVSPGGLKLTKSLNFTCHKFMEKKAIRHMCFLKLPTDLNFQAVIKHLTFQGDAEIVDSICWREPLSKNSNSIIGRC